MRPVPPLKWHKGTGQAYARMPGGAFRYFGQYGTEKANAAYARFAPSEPEKSSN